MTPAVRIVKKACIQFVIHEYAHESQSSSQALSYGEEASTVLGVPAQQVFKTLLVMTNDKQLAVAVIPVSHQLNLKLVAKALHVKKVAMADPHEAKKATGYVLGGISPLGQKKRLDFMIDKSANDFPTIYVSGGRIGLEIELSPDDLIKLCQATVINCV